MIKEVSTSTFVNELAIECNDEAVKKWAEIHSTLRVRKFDSLIKQEPLFPQLVVRARKRENHDSEDETVEMHKDNLSAF